MKSCLRFLGRLLPELLLLLLGVLGALGCLCTAFPALPATPELWRGTLGLGLLCCLALGHRKWDRLLAPLLLAALILLCYLRWDRLSESFLALWGELIGQWAEGYDMLRDFVPRRLVPPGEAGPALLALSAGMSWLCALSIRSWKRTGPAALALLLGVGPCFVLTDTPPAVLPLLVTAGTVLTLALSESARRREAEPGKAVALGALLAAALLGLLLLLCPQERYEPPISWQELSQKLELWNQSRNNQGNRKAGLSGRPEKVTLSTLGALPKRRVEMLRVHSEQGGGVYLRGVCYTEFDGEHWTQDLSRSWPVETLFPDLDPGGRPPATDLIRVEALREASVFYTTPWLTGALPEGAVPVSDAYLDNPAQRTSYQFSALLEPLPARPDSAYDAWVRAHCLALPGRTRQEVLAWWASVGGGSASVSSLDQIRQVAERVSQCAVYSRNPERVPAGRDFCGWFLSEAREGYCVHYATSCAALLRALGVPARYVTGYYCQAQAGATVSVTNLQAHAWVEVWLDGRWLPVEPTPADATEFTGELPPEPVSIPLPSNGAPLASAVPTPDSRPAESAEPAEPTEPASRPARSTELTEPPRPSVRPTRPDGEARTEEAAPASLTPLWVFLGAAGLLALVLGRRALALELWRRRLARADANEQGRLLYRRSLRLSRGGEPLPPRALALANKASFSQHRLSDEELCFLRGVLARQTAQLRRGGFWRRQYYRWVLALI